MNISEKDKKALFILLLFLIAVFYYIFFAKGQLSAMSQLMQNKTRLRQKLSSIENDINAFDKNKRDALTGDYIKISRKLPPNQDEKFSIMDAYNISNKLGCKIGDIFISKKDAAPIEKDGKKVQDVFSYTLKVNWSMTYENFKKLLSYYDEYDVMYTISNLSAVPGNDGKINTSMDIKFYGFNDKYAPVRIWNNYNVETGKDNIFMAATAVSRVSSAQNDTESIEYIKKIKDFTVVLSTLNAPTGSVLLEKSGKGIDILGSNKSIENININVSGSNGIYRYSMATGANSYPKDGGSEEFKPVSDRITIYVSSQPRKYQDDKNQVVINIHNDSDKKVYVYVADDDDKLPRATIVKDG